MITFFSILVNLVGNSFNTFLTLLDLILARTLFFCNISLLTFKGKSSVSQGDLIVSVITELSTDLIQEGYIREIVRSLQNMRKEADFNVEDRIKVFCLAENDMGDVIRKHEDYFRSEVLAVELYFGEIKGELTKEISVGGDAILFGISRVKD